jgi:hypothetical protein
MQDERPLRAQRSSGERNLVGRHVSIGVGLLGLGLWAGPLRGAVHR